MITPGVRVIYFRKKHKWRTFTEGYAKSSRLYRLMVANGKPTPINIKAGEVMLEYYKILDRRRWNIRDYPMSVRGVTVIYDEY